MKTRNTNSLSSVVESVLEKSSETGITVKEALNVVQGLIKECNPDITVNYRAVYQQLKNLGEKLSKGRFVSRKNKNQESAVA